MIQNLIWCCKGRNGIIYALLIFEVNNMVGKPKNDVAMTSTERSRQYRLRKKQQGEREVTLVFSEDAVKKLDELVELFELQSRSTAVAQLLQVPLDNAIVAMEGFKDGIDAEIVDAIDGEVAEFWLKLRKALWGTICLQDKQARDDLLQTVTNMVEKTDGQ